MMCLFLVVFVIASMTACELALLRTLNSILMRWTDVG